MGALKTRESAERPVLWNGISRLALLAETVASLSVNPPWQDAVFGIGPQHGQQAIAFPQAQFDRIAALFHRV